MKSSAVVILLLGICLGTTGLVHAQDLQITPSDLGWTQLGSGAYLGSYLYRDVAVGESETATFTFESLGPTAVWGYTMGLVESTDPSDSSFTTPIGLGFPDYPAPSGAIWDYTLGAFSLVPDDWTIWDDQMPPSGALVPILPREMPVGEILTINVIFAPPSSGVFDVYFFSQSSDTILPPGSAAFIHLEGRGVESAVPEPATILLLGLGLIGLAGVRKGCVSRR